MFQNFPLAPSSSLDVYTCMYSKILGIEVVATGADPLVITCLEEVAQFSLLGLGIVLFKRRSLSLPSWLVAPCAVQVNPF